MRLRRDRLDQRRQEAKVRQEAYDRLSTLEKIKRLGKHVALRQRERLHKEMAGDGGRI